MKSSNQPNPKSKAPAGILATVLIAAALGLANAASAGQRPISDFLTRQGTYCLDDGSGGCLLFVPPAGNFLGWSDPKTAYFTAFDYAGIANAYVGGAFGTTMSGTVDERPLPDGRAEVSVVLQTRNALAWASSAANDFPGPILFGHLLSEVLAGAEPVLGSCTLQVRFINTAPGAPLPDLIQLLFVPEASQALEFLAFSAEARGGLRAAFGVPEGTAGVLQTRQSGLVKVAGIANSNSRVARDAFPAEKVVIQKAGK